MRNIIPYGKQSISDEDIAAVIEVLKSDFITQGPVIEQFEKAFAQYLGSKYAVAVSSGTAALHLTALALGVKKGTKVITTPITFVASANCVLYAGGEIEFCDIDPKTYTIDIDKLQYLLESKPRGTYSGIIPVDLAGYAVNHEAIHYLAKKYNLWVLEDACHALGAGFIDSTGQLQLCGNGFYFDASVFSFHPVKHITTGEGGIITTNSKDIYEKLLMLRTHGITKKINLLYEHHGGWYYEMHQLGYNYRLSDIHAALGLSQLKRADMWLQKRRDIAHKYNAELKGVGDIVTPFVAENVLHAYHLYIIQTHKRKELYDFLKNKNIFTQVHYIPIHTFPYYKQFGWKKGDFPIAENYYNNCLSLPMYPTLTEDQQNYVISCIKDFYS